jgi:hypothetical protein
MVVPKPVFAVAVAFLCSLTAWPGAALSEEPPQGKLPPGYYVYLGQQPGVSPPKALTISAGGSIIWQDSSSDQAAQKEPLKDILSTPQPAAPDPAHSGGASGTESQFETYEYPIIKWRPKPIADVPGAFAQLWTTYIGSSGTYGTMKYRLTLLKAPSPVPALEVQILDRNGFKVTGFTAAGTFFEPIPGTSLVEARDQRPCREEDYKAACDYTVGQNTSPAKDARTGRFMRYPY